MLSSRSELESSSTAQASKRLVSDIISPGVDPLQPGYAE